MFYLFMFSMANWCSYMFTMSIMNKVSIYVFLPSILLFCFFQGYFVWGKLTEKFEEMINNYEG